MSTTPNAIAGAAPNAGAESTIEQPDLEVSLPSGPEADAQPNAGELEPGQQPDAQKPDQSLEPKEDNRVIPSHIRELKDKNPEAYKRAKGDFFDLRDRRAVHPTVQAAREEHELVQGLGGPEAISQLREDGQFFKQAAQQFLRGDKAFYADLWDEDQTAAETGLPIMLELAREKSKDVYDATLSRIWDEEFKSAGWDPVLQKLYTAVENGEKERALGLVEALHNWRKGYTGKAQRAEDPRIKRMMAERATEQENKGKTEREQFLTSYKADSVNEVVSDAAKAFDAYFKSRKLEEDDRNDLLREVLAIANRAVIADKQFVSQRDKHLENGDANAAKRLTKSRYAQALPEAIKRVARRYGILAGNPKPAPTPEKGASPGSTQPKPEQGFAQVNQRPAPNEIDQTATASVGRKMGKTYQEMIMAGLAVRTDGRKVSWAHLKQKVA